MPVVQANGLDIHYRIDGDGPETLLLINGVGDDLDGWGLQRDELAAAGLRVVTFDNRGCGSSSHPPGPYTSRQMAEDASALARALDLAPLHLCGVSMGGCIAQEYAAACPDDLLSLVLASTYAVPDPLTRAAFDSWALVAQAAGMRVMMQQQAPWVFSTGFYSAQPGRLAEFLAEMDRTTQPAASFAAQIAALTTHDCESRLGLITMPTLVLASADDIIIKPELSRRLFNGLPRASWQLLPGGHAAFLEDPPCWNAAVLAFIDQHRLYRSAQDAR